MRTIQSRQTGFTLIELMIVIAIVAILVALALPAYRDFTVRAKFGECIAGGAPVKANITEYYDTVGSMPLTQEAAGIELFKTGNTQYCTLVLHLPLTGAYIIASDEGSLGPNIPILGVVFIPQVNSAGGLDWFCINAGEPSSAKYLPAPCRSSSLLT